MTRAVVVGSGLAGLSAARTLAAAGHEVVVLERADRVGGRVRSHRLGDVAVDVGAQFVAPFCTEVLAAARACGLGHLPQTALHGAVVDRDGVHAISATAVLRSSLLTPGERLRLAGLVLPVLRRWGRLDPHDLTRAARWDDRSAEALVTAWAGRASAERLFGPVLRGLLYWDLESTTQVMLLAVLRLVPSTRAVHHVPGGLARLAVGLADPLDVRTRTTASGLHRADDGSWLVELDGGARLSARHVVCATTASVAARLVERAAPDVARSLRTVGYTRTRVLTVRVAGAGPDSTLVFPRAWAPELAAVTLAHRDPQGTVVKVFLSDSGARAWAGLPAATVGGRALAALRAAGCEWADGGVVLDTWAWDEALPRFDVGSVRARPMPAWAPAVAPGLAFAGDYLGGPFLEGAWASGRAAAELLLDGRRPTGG